MYDINTLRYTIASLDYHQKSNLDTNYVPIEYILHLMHSILNLYLSITNIQLILVLV